MRERCRRRCARTETYLAMKAAFEEQEAFSSVVLGKRCGGSPNTSCLQSRGWGGLLEHLRTVAYTLEDALAVVLEVPAVEVVSLRGRALPATLEGLQTLTQPSPLGGHGHRRAKCVRDRGRNDTDARRPRTRR
jgi:hypothetical protein